VSARQFEEFRASSLFCLRCAEAKPARETLLLVLPDREIYEYRCEVCADAIGRREVTAADAIAVKVAQRRRSGRGRSSDRVNAQVRIL
jgi:hypothetical protein